MTAIFDALSEPVAKRVTAGLVKIGQVLRTHAWRGAGSAGISPSQGQALSLIQDAQQGIGLGELAKQLGVAAPTASEMVNSLVAKGLAVKGPGADKRSVRLTLTEQGRTLAAQTAAWPAFLVDAVDTLDPDDKAVFLRSLVRVIRALQIAGDIAPQAMCVTCRFFRPHAHADAAAPHHCQYVDAPFGDRHLRLNCAEHVLAPPADLDAIWARFTGRPEQGSPGTI
ncbi:MarR family winged helix-turn-helix transcriptional regulator [Sphingopyxis sp. KK2]|uniref:MarR family winged helix-turn-helix transcriptional regulator n=1 Tax=Sphingopyxis sp. KK2 TaxID=1855727 RepID=UPI001C4E0ECA|nr:MarR family winged helix-turn-helix transcriptional regulator [Sphingopyxis sp. KK2]